MAVELGTGYISLSVEASKLKGEFSKLADSIASDLNRQLAGAGQDAARRFTGEFDDVGRKIGADIEKDVGGVGAQVGSDIADGAESSGLGSKLGSIVKGGVVAVAAAAGAALAKGVTDAYAAEATNAKLAASLGLSPEQADAAGKAAGAVYRQGIGESLDEVSATVGELIETGLIPRDAAEADIAALTSKLSTFTKVFDVEASEVTRAAQAMIANGMVGTAEEALDLFTAAKQRGLDIDDDLFATVEEYSNALAGIGVTGPLAFDLLSQAQALGIRDTDKAADALKEFGIRAMEAGDETRAAWQSLGLDAEATAQEFAKGGPAALAMADQVNAALQAVEDPVERNRLGVATYGDLWNEVSGQIVGVDFTPAVNAYGDVTGAAEGLGVVNDTAAAKIERFKRQALGGLADFAAAYVLPAIARLGDIVQTHVLPRLQEFGGWLQTNVVPVLQQLGQWLNDNVVPALQAFAGFIVDVVLPAVVAWAGWMADNLAPVVQAVAERVAALVPHLQEIGRRVQADVLPPLQELWQRFTDDILPILKAVAEFVYRQLVPAFVEIQQKIDSVVLPVLARIVTFIGDVIAAHVRLYDQTKAVIGALVEFGRDVKAQFDAVVDFVKGLPGRISSAASGMWDGISGAFRSMVNGLISLWNNSVGGFRFQIPDFIPGVGGKGFTIPSIPALADGGVIDRPTLALLGETGRARPEIVTPEALMREVLGDVLDERGGGGVRIENHFHDSRVDANEAGRAISWSLRQTGVLA